MLVECVWTIHNITINIKKLGRIPSSLSLSYAFTSREEIGSSNTIDNKRVNMREGIFGPVTTQNSSPTAINSFDLCRDEKVKKFIPTHQKVSKEDILEKKDKIGISRICI